MTLLNLAASSYCGKLLHDRNCMVALRVVSLTNITYLVIDTKCSTLSR